MAPDYRWRPAGAPGPAYPAPDIGWNTASMKPPA